MAEEPTETTLQKRRKSAPPKDWRVLFLTDLRESGVVRYACNAAHVNRTTAYAERNRNGEFSRLWDEALEDAVDDLEGEARKRAIDGSDTLLIFLLKANRPDKYREMKFHVTHDFSRMTDADIEAEIAREIGEALSTTGGSEEAEPSN